MSAKANSAVRSTPFPLARLILRNVLALPVAAGLIWLLAQRMATADPATIAAAIAGISPAQWLAAAIFAALSFLAIGEYDRMFHRLGGTGIDAGTARRSGMMAMALAQMLGLGVISGALVRWRLTPEFDLWRATRFSALVSASFLGGFAVLAALAVHLTDLRHLPHGADLLAALVLAAAFALILASVFLRHIHIAGRLVMLPPVARLLRIIVVVAADCLAAAACAHVLMPAGVSSGFLAFLPVFLIASGAGLVSGAPAGLGAYELTLLALLPDVSGAAGQDAVLASALAFRLVYHALPASIAALLALVIMVQPPRQAVIRAPMPLHRHALPSPEAGLLHQGRLSLWQGDGAGFMGATTGQALVAVLDPAGPPDRALALLCAQAAASDRIPCLYKVGARMALSARRAGFTLWRIAEEAIVTPADFALSAPPYARLRRKLRHAEAAGLRCEAASLSQKSFRELSAINSEWAARHGGERGFSMGRFDTATLHRQKVFVARQDGKAIAFVSFHHSASQGGQGWTLDLVRHRDCVPDGTMHSLIVAAIGAARDQGVARLSLAAVHAPARPMGEGLRGRLAQALFDVLVQRWAAKGLRQFKQSFAPRWNPLYAAAPGPLRLALALAEIAAEVHHPPRMRTDGEDRQPCTAQLPVCLAAPAMR